MFIELLFKIVLFKGGVLIYAEHCVYIYIYIYIYIHNIQVCNLPFSFGVLYREKTAINSTFETFVNVQDWREEK